MPAAKATSKSASGGNTKRQKAQPTGQATKSAEFIHESDDEEDQGKAKTAKRSNARAGNSSAKVLAPKSKPAPKAKVSAKHSSASRSANDGTEESESESPDGESSDAESNGDKPSSETEEEESSAASVTDEEDKATTIATNKSTSKVVKGVSSEEASSDDEANEDESSGSGGGADESAEEEEEDEDEDDSSGTEEALPDDPIPEEQAQDPSEEASDDDIALPDYKPPAGLDLTNVSNKDAMEISQLLALEDLEGKQIWSISAPTSLPPSAIQEIALNFAKDEEAVLSFEDVEYGMVSDLVEKKGKREAFLLPSLGPGAYTSTILPVERRFHLQRTLKIPTHIRQPAPSTHSNSPPQRTGPQPHNQLPPGLKMRWHAFGIPRRTNETLSDSESSESEIEHEQPHNTSPKKRKHDAIIDKAQTTTSTEYTHKPLPIHHQSSLDPTVPTTSTPASRKHKKSKSVHFDELSTSNGVIAQPALMGYADGASEDVAMADPEAQAKAERKIARRRAKEERKKLEEDERGHVDKKEKRKKKKKDKEASD